MDIEEHHSKFKKIIQKYKLDLPNKAEELANYLSKELTTPEEFSKLFNLSIYDAKIVLSFIAKGVHYKKNYLK